MKPDIKPINSRPQGPNGPADPASPGSGTYCGRVDAPVPYSLMASWDQLKEQLNKYNLTYVWDFDLYGDFKKVPGYKIYPEGFTRLSGNLPPVGLLPSSDLSTLTGGELEEFVVGCSVLSMYRPGDVWQV